MKYFIITFRSFFFYFLITIVYRLMGKREIGELSVMDFIVSIYIAELVAISIENYDKTILISLIPIIILVSLELLTSYVSLKNKKVRDIIDGKPSIIIENGKINFKEMVKQRYNLDDLLGQLRKESIKSIEEVDYAILEINGDLSIFKKSDDKKHSYPLPIILDGVVDYNVLFKINKDYNWLMKELNKQNIDINNIFYSFYKDNKLFIIEKDKL